MSRGGSTAAGVATAAHGENLAVGISGYGIWLAVSFAVNGGYAPVRLYQYYVHGGLVLFWRGSVYVVAESRISLVVIRLSLVGFYRVWLSLRICCLFYFLLSIHLGDIPRYQILIFDLMALVYIHNSKFSVFISRSCLLYSLSIDCWWFNLITLA